MISGKNLSFILSYEMLERRKRIDQLIDARMKNKNFVLSNLKLLKMEQKLIQ